MYIDGRLLIRNEEMGKAINTISRVKKSWNTKANRPYTIPLRWMLQKKGDSEKDSRQIPEIYFWNITRYLFYGCETLFNHIIFYIAIFRNGVAIFTLGLWHHAIFMANYNTFCNHIIFTLGYWNNRERGENFPKFN